jgi:hypothetical protein
VESDVAKSPDWTTGKMLRFKLGSATLVLSEGEMRALLGHDLTIYENGLVRGKAVVRRKALRARMTQGGDS